MCRNGARKFRRRASPIGCSRRSRPRPAPRWPTRTAPPTDYAAPGCQAALRYWLDLQAKGVHPPGVVEWGTTPRDFLERKVAMIWTTTGNLSNIRANAKFPFGVGDAAGRQAARQPDRRRQFLPVQDGAAGAADRRAAFPALDQQPRARRAMGHRHRLRRDPAGRLGDPGDAGTTSPASRPRPSPGTSCNTRSPNCPRTTTSASPRR